jgi:hypothetical protein
MFTRQPQKACDATNVAVDLWPKPRRDFGRFHPSHFYPELVERIAKATNVDAIKAYISDGLGMWDAIQQRGGDKVLLPSAEVEEWPVTVAAYKQQWARPADYAIFDETADNPRIARMFNLFRQGDFSKGMELYWELTPITIGPGVQCFNQV